MRLNLSWDVKMNSWNTLNAYCMRQGQNNSNAYVCFGCIRTESASWWSLNTCIRQTFWGAGRWWLRCLPRSSSRSTRDRRWGRTGRGTWSSPLRTCTLERVVRVGGPNQDEFFRALLWPRVHNLLVLPWCIDKLFYLIEMERFTLS